MTKTPLSKVTLKYCVWARRDVRRKSDDRLLFSSGEVVESVVTYGMTEDKAREEANKVWKQFKHHKLTIWLYKDGFGWWDKSGLIHKFDNSAHEKVSNKK